MFGYDCHSNFITTRGFTFSRIMGDHDALNVADVLKFNDIEFTMDYASAWTLRINISAKKANLKKIDDLYNAYTELPELELNYENFIKIHQLLSANLLPESERGKVRDNIMVVMDNNDRIVYTACDHFLVPTELNKLFEDIEYLIEEELDEFEIFFFASLIHLVFVMSPFIVGKGKG
jgi:hypothetical protein